MKKYLIPLILLSLVFGQFRRVNIEAIAPFVDVDVDSSLQEMNASDGVLYRVWVISTNSDDMWLRFYDQTADTIATGGVKSDAVLKLLVPENDGAGSDVQFYDFGPYGLPFQKGIK